MNLPQATQAAVEALASELGTTPEEAILRAVNCALMLRWLLWLGSPLNPRPEEGTVG